MLNFFNRKHRNRIDELECIIDARNRTIERLENIINMRKTTPNLYQTPIPEELPDPIYVDTQDIQERRFSTTNIMDDDVTMNTKGTSFGVSVLNECNKQPNRECEYNERHKHPS